MRESDVEELVRRHLVELGCVVSSGSTGPTRAVDLIAIHPALEQPLTLEVKSGLGPVSFAPASDRGHVLLAAPHFPPSTAAAVRAAGYAGWIDAAGNADIEADGLRVLIRGQRDAAVDRAVMLDASRGWSARPTGLRVLFALLTIPDMLNARLVDIARHAGVSTATAQRSITDLGRQGLVDAEGPTRVWLDRPEAVRAWTEGYTRTVIPRVREVPFHCDDAAQRLLAHRAEVTPPLWVSAGEALRAYGADILPVDALIYRPERETRTGLEGVVDVRPPRTPDRPANLFIRTAWWAPDSYPPGLVPPLLAYADAITSRDPRVMAAAGEVLDADPDLRAALA